MRVQKKSVLVAAAVSASDIFRVYIIYVLIGFCSQLCQIVRYFILGLDFRN